MAIKISGTTVIDDNRKLVNLTNTPGIPDQPIYFTASGTYTPSTNAKYAFIQVVGGGGGGAGSNITSSSSISFGIGGGAGAYAEKTIDLSGITSATITIGAGGAGGFRSNGTTGGTTTYDDGTNIITCTGGDGGDRTETGGGTADNGQIGGTATGGDLNVGGGGSNACRGNENRNDPLGSNGGSSYLAGGGGGTRGGDPSGDAQDGGFPGGGGGAASAFRNTGVGRYGGDGGDGIVIITEYF